MKLICVSAIYCASLRHVRQEALGGKGESMYLVAIGWLYVALMMSITERSVIAGITTFLFYGLLPLGLFLWIFGSGHRRRMRELREAQVARQQVEAVEGAEPHALEPTAHQPKVPAPDEQTPADIRPRNAP